MFLWKAPLKHYLSWAFLLILLAVFVLLFARKFDQPPAQSSISGLEKVHGDPAQSLYGKLIVGYQGWFGCPGDFADNRVWDHWSFKNPDPENLMFDLLPATDEYSGSDLYPTSMTRRDGSKVSLFSSLSPGIVNKHFQWMREYGIDGVAFQRFVAYVAVPQGCARHDRVLSNVRKAAESNGRVFFVTYDVSGDTESTVYEHLQKDWQHLIKDLKITSSPNYLRHKGKPVLQIWGFGFHDRPGEPDKVKALLLKLKAGDDCLPPVTLVGGVPTCWRTLWGDSKTDRSWASVYACYDVLSPWTVNRFGDDLGAYLFVKVMVLPDMAEARRLGVDYMPVIFPGFSWYNLKHCQNQPEKAILNRVPRRSGRFYWKQIHELLAEHTTMVFAAMFDEVNEGTALFKVETRPERLPVRAQLLYPEMDGEDVPADLYLRLSGMASQYLKSRGTVPENMPLKN